MKKAIYIMGLMGLGALLFWGLSATLTPERGTGIAGLDPDTESRIVPAGYLPVAPFSGPDFTTAAEKTVHGVVHIRSVFTRKSSLYDEFFGPFRDFFGYPYQGDQSYSGYGSGVIISGDGYIVTNNHVVEGASEIEVILNDKRTFDAELIGRDPKTDLALIKVSTEELPYITFGNSDQVRIGEWVLAVGNPFNLTSTVTAGIVSAKARNINILGTPGAIESFIQTDAAVNRGNSGGALVNMNGELIGVNAAIASNTGSYTGYSFAIPVNIVKKVVDDLLTFGQVQRAYLGVVIREVDSKLVSEKDLDVNNGVYIDKLSENGGAATAGIREGDVITGINGMVVTGNAELLEIIGQHDPGDVVTVQVNRSGSLRDFQVELRNEEGTTSVTKAGEGFYLEDLGASFEPVDKGDMSKLNIDHGLKVVELGDGILKKGGVQEGFIILEINNYEINSKQDIEYALQSLAGNVIRISGVYTNGMRMNYGFIL
jgi:Do/DeqQ family serine protease